MTSDICSKCDRNIQETLGHWGKQLCGYHLYLKQTVWGTHKITQSQYETLLETQNYRCGVCKSDDPLKVVDLSRWRKPKLCIDHNHTTGQVRGLLCGACNRKLGVIGDSYEALMSPEITHSREVSYLFNAEILNRPDESDVK